MVQWCLEEGIDVAPREKSKIGVATREESKIKEIEFKMVSALDAEDSQSLERVEEKQEPPIAERMSET